MGAVGFEPTRLERIGFTVRRANQLLNAPIFCIPSEIRTHTCTDFKSDASAIWAIGTFVHLEGFEPSKLLSLNQATLPICL